MKHRVLEQLGFEYCHDGHPSNEPYWRCAATGTEISETRAALIFSKGEALQLIHESGRKQGQSQQHARIRAAVEKLPRTFEEAA